MEPLPLWEAAKREMEEYQFVSSANVQPKWKVPEKIAINVAVSSRFTEGASTNAANPTSLEDYVDEASRVIEAGACGVHIDFTWVTDKHGRRLDRDLPPVEAYSAVIEPLRARFGHAFVPNLNVLNGTTFEMCMSPAKAGLAEACPCAPGHPDAFMIPAVSTMEQLGVKPELAVHHSGEIELERFPHDLTRQGFPLRRRCDSNVLLVAGGQHGWHARFHRIFGTGLLQRLMVA